MTQANSSNIEKTHKSTKSDSSLSKKTSPKLEVNSLFKTFGNRGKQLTILQDINIHLQESEFVCVVGTSGCGKSTLLSIIVGLVQPSSNIYQ